MDSTDLKNNHNSKNVDYEWENKPAPLKQFKNSAKTGQSVSRERYRSVTNKKYL